MGYNAGIQMHGSKKPLNNIVPNVKQKTKTKNMKERLKKILKNKDFLDKKTVEYLERMGYINTDI